MKRSTCSHCLKPNSVCYCHTLTKVENSWPVVIFQHSAEAKHAIGTARIALLSLGRCQLKIAKQFSLEDLLPLDSQPLMIYPDENAMPLNEVDILSTRTLVFIDASWRKSRKILYESPELMALPKAVIQPSAESRYRIRKVPHKNALSTLEAVVAVLGYLENDDEKFLPLLNTMDWMLEKQIELMGSDIFTHNYL